MSESRPSDLAILLAMSLAGQESVYADEIRGQLVRLGFDVATRHVVPALQRMARQDCPAVAVQRYPYQPSWPASYSLTPFGHTWLRNSFRGYR